MANSVVVEFLFIFCFVFLIHDAVSDVDKIEDIKTTSCEEKCETSFLAQNEGERSACLRGCRLYTITKFITADEPKPILSIEGNDLSPDRELSPAMMLCHHSCSEAYNETSSSSDACKVGCKNQELTSKSDEEAQEVSNFHLLRPLMEIHEVTSKVAGMLRVVQSSLTTYFMREDHSIVAVKGPVQVMVQLNSETPEEESFPTDETKHQPVLKEKIFDSLNEEDTLSCFSRRLGVPPYVLLISFVSFAIFFIYIFLVVCPFNGKKEKQKMTKASPIPTHNLPIKLVRPEDLTKLSLIDEEETQASDLPVKFKLPDNTRI